MQNSEMGGNTKEEMAPPKPLLRPILSFQVLQKTHCGDATGTSSSSPQAPNENNKVDNPPTRNAVSGAGSVIDKKLRRIMSNRLSAQRSRLKKLRFLVNLKFEAKALENQIAELQQQHASYLHQKQIFMVEKQTLLQEMVVLQKETLLRDAEIEKNQGEVNRLRKLRVTQQEQLQARLQYYDIGLLEPVSNDQVAGNGVETPYIPPERSHIRIPAVPNMHETNLTLSNYTGSMEANHRRGTAPNPNLN